MLRWYESGSGLGDVFNGGEMSQVVGEIRSKRDHGGCTEVELSYLDPCYDLLPERCLILGALNKSRNPAPHSCSNNNNIITSSGGSNNTGNQRDTRATRNLRELYIACASVINMSYTDDAVKAKLSALNETQEAIVTVAQWIMFHRYAQDCEILQQPASSKQGRKSEVLTLFVRTGSMQRELPSCGCSA
jgi:hypothetical protein